MASVSETTSGNIYLVTQHSLLSQLFLFLLPDQHLCIVKKMYMCMHIYIYDSIKTVYKLPFLQNNTKSDIFLHNSGALLRLTGYSSLGRRQDGDWRIRDIGQNNLYYSFQTRSSSSPQLLQYFLLYRILPVDFYSKCDIIIIIRFNYNIHSY